MIGQQTVTATIESLILEGAITAHKDGNYGSNYPRTNEFSDNGVLFLTAKNVSDSGSIDFTNVARLAVEKADTLTYGFVEANDVLLSHNATVGRVAVMPELGERALVGTSLTYFRLNPKLLLPAYLAAYFRGRHFQNQLAAVMSHSTRNQVPITAQRKLLVAVPPLDEQVQIATALGCLDSKIELNRRMNRTLEQMAAAIFKAWFVDFEPVKAKAAGATRFASMPQEVFDALPTQFTDSALGPIPNGWGISNIKEQCSLVMGQSPRSEFYNGIGEGLPFHQGVRLFGERFPSHKTYCTILKRLAETGDVLFSVRAPVGRINVANRQLIVGRGLAAIRHHADAQSFLLYSLKQTFTAEDSIGSGTIFASVTKKDMEGIELLAPCPEMLTAFEQCVGPLDERYALNVRESITLAEIRDTLLPKLLSGEIRVGTAEKQVEEVA